MARGSAVALALVVAAVVSACGGGGDGVTRAEYIARADTICAALREQVNALPFSSPDPEVLAQAFREGARLGDEQVEQLRRLEPPPDDVEEITAILDLAERLNSVGRAAADAKTAGDDVRFREYLRQSRDIQLRQRELALRYGFRACAGRP